MNVALTPAERRSIGRLRLQPRRSRSGRVRGERLSKRKGVSIDFADFRDYVDGDDLRHLDWNALARLGVPLLRTYQDEEDLTIYLLVDRSASLDYGDPTKHLVARRLGLALASAAANGGDAVAPWALGAPPTAVRRYRGRPGLFAMSEWLGAQSTTDRTPLTEGIDQFLRADQPTGVALLVTDGLDPGLASAIRRMGARGHEPWVLVVLTPAELDPELEGDLRLMDAEGGAPVEITASRATIAEYRTNLQTHLDELGAATAQAGGRFASVSTEMAFEEVLHGILRREGWLA